MSQYPTPTNGFERFCLAAIEANEYSGNILGRDPDQHINWQAPYTRFKPDACLSVEWCSGGVTGGSCWGGTPDRPVDPEDPRNLDSLDTLLERICPSITFLQFRQLQKLMQTTTRHNNDYYGNSSIYTVLFLPLRSLYDKLQELGLLPEEFQ